MACLDCRPPRAMGYVLGNSQVTTFWATQGELFGPVANSHDFAINRRGVHALAEPKKLLAVLSDVDARSSWQRRMLTRAHDAGVPAA